jgi:hypothetical protein
MQEKNEKATEIYISLLEKEPDNYNILAHLIELLKRSGNL